MQVALHWTRKDGGSGQGDVPLVQKKWDKGYVPLSTALANAPPVQRPLAIVSLGNFEILYNFTDAAFFEGTAQANLFHKPCEEIGG